MQITTPLFPPFKLVPASSRERAKGNYELSERRIVGAEKVVKKAKWIRHIQ
jgi:hypothetical protein